MREDINDVMPSLIGYDPALTKVVVNRTGPQMQGVRIIHIVEINI